MKRPSLIHLRVFASSLLLLALVPVLRAAPNLPLKQADRSVRAPLEICTEMKLRHQAVAGALEAWADKSKFWPAGAVLRVKFLSGSSGQKAEAWKRMMQIQALVNLSFKQVTSGASEIRVNFDRGKGHWSYVGKDCLNIPANQPTMNLALKSGFFGDGGTEWDRVALHETLHAIGLMHEHQHPQAHIPWDVPAVMAFYKNTQGWDEAEIRFQVLNAQLLPSFVGTRWDGTSIMEYPIPAELVTDSKFVVGWNTKLSPLDVVFLRSVYPKK